MLHLSPTSLHPTNLHTLGDSLANPHPNPLLHPIRQRSDPATFSRALRQEHLCAPTVKHLLHNRLGNILRLHDLCTALLDLRLHGRNKWRPHPVGVDGGGQNIRGVVREAQFLVER